MSEDEKEPTGINRRKYIRTPLRSLVKLKAPEVGELELHTANISDGGAYIFSDGHSMPDLGSLVDVQVQLPGGEAPTVKMRVVRFDSMGLGLEFVDDSQGE